MAVSYQLVVPERFEEAVQLVNNYFLTDETLLNSIGHRQSDIEKLDQLILRYLEQNLSWCAVDESTGRLVGVAICFCKSITDLPNATPTFDEFVKGGWSRELASILFLLNSLLDGKEILTSYKESKMFELFVGVVHPDYRNRGIAIEIARRTLDHAVTVGFTLAGVVCTNIYTQRLFEKQGFERVKEEFYASYVDPGTNSTVFENVAKPQKSAVSYVKKIV